MSATVNIDQITEIRDRLPVGQYQARLLDVVAKESKAQKPMISALFEVIDGERAGDEATIYYSLTVSEGKNGRKFAGGIIDLKRTFAAVGAPLPAGFNMPYGDLEAADKVRKLYAKQLANKTVTIAVLPDKGREAKTDQSGNAIVYTRTQVIGTKKLAAVKSADDNMFDDLEETA